MVVVSCSALYISIFSDYQEPLFVQEYVGILVFSGLTKQIEYMLQTFNKAFFTIENKLDC